MKIYAEDENRSYQNRLSFAQRVCKTRPKNVSVIYGVDIVFNSHYRMSVFSTLLKDMPKFCYDYPHPALTTDIALFTIRDDQLAILLIRRRAPPFQGCWALPGGFVDPDECLEDCALRELAEETGITGVYLEQLYTFGPWSLPSGMASRIRPNS